MRAGGSEKSPLPCQARFLFFRLPGTQAANFLIGEPGLCTASSLTTVAGRLQAAWEDRDRLTIFPQY